jgi:hypothetical protein
VRGHSCSKELILIFHFTGTVINSLALTYCAPKRPEDSQDAVPLQRQLLEFRKRTLPADDPLQVKNQM